MSDQNFTIKISSAADVSGIEAAQAAQSKLNAEVGRFTEAAKEASAAPVFQQAAQSQERMAQGLSNAATKQRELTSATEEFVNTLKLGVGMDLGGKIVESIVEVPNLIYEATRRGVEFNAEIETATFSVAGMVKQFNPAEIHTFNDALGASGQIIETLRKKSNEFGIDFQSTLEAYKTTAGAMYNAGVVDLQKQVELTLLLQQAFAGMGISGFQATRDAQDIFTGMADRTKAGRELGLSDADIKAAEAQGKVYEYLEQKLSGFAQSGAAAMGTLTAETNRFNNELSQVLGQATVPVFDALKASLEALNQELQRPGVANELKKVGVEIGSLVSGGAALLQWALQNSGALLELGKSVATLGVALAAIKITEIVIGLGLQAAAFVASGAAIDTETAALVANTAAASANAAARGGAGVGIGASAGVTASGTSAAAGGLFLPAALLAALAGTGVSLGKLIDAPSSGTRDGRNSRIQSDLSTQNQLQNDAFSADSSNADDVRVRIAREIHRANLEIKEDDADLSAAARGRIEAYTQILALLEQQVPLNDKAAGQEESKAASADDFQESAKVAARNDAAWRKATNALGGAYDSAYSTEGGDPLSDLQRKLERQRSEFSEQAANSVPFNVDKNADVGTLLGAAGSAVNPQSMTELSQKAQEIAATEKQISAEEEKQQKHAEEEATQAEKKSQKQKELLADLADENNILAAQVTGNKSQVTELTNQRNLHREINRLMASGLSEKEAAAQAKITGELQKQLQLRQQAEALTKARDKDDVQTARGPTAKKHAELKQYLDDQSDQYDESGMSPEEKKRRLTNDEHSFRRLNGIYGGDATLSPNDSIAGLDNGPSSGLSGLLSGQGGSSSFNDLMSGTGGSKSFGDLTSGGGASDAFKSLNPFGKSPINGGALIPQDPTDADNPQFDAAPAQSSAPAQSGGGDGGGSGALQSAAAQQTQAGQQLNSAASSLQASATQVTTAAQTIANAADALSTAMQAISNLDARITALEDDAGA